MSFLSNPLLQNTTSVFQAAFGVNAVFVVIIDHFLKRKKQISLIFFEKLQRVNPEFYTTERRVLVDAYLHRNLLGPLVQRRFFLACIVLALLSVLLSFYYLVDAAFQPDRQIQSVWFLIVSVWMLLFNPLAYYLFIIINNYIVNVFKSRMIIDEGGAEFVKIIVDLNAAMEELSGDKDVVKNRLAELRRRRMMNRLKPIIHPIQFIAKWRSDRAVEKILRRYENKPQN